MSVVEEPSAFEQLDAMLAPMTDAGRRELYLLLARAGIENGDRRAAEVAAERALKTAEPGTLAARRAALYQAAAEVVNPEKFAGARAKLAALEGAELPQDDRAILYAAMRLWRTVSTRPRSSAATQPGESHTPTSRARAAGAQETPAAAAAPSPDGPDNETNDRSHGTVSFDVAAVERRVADVVARIDALLEDTR